MSIRFPSVFVLTINISFLDNCRPVSEKVVKVMDLYIKLTEYEIYTEPLKGKKVSCYTVLKERCSYSFEGAV